MRGPGLDRNAFGRPGAGVAGEGDGGDRRSVRDLRQKPGLGVAVPVAESRPAANTPLDSSGEHSSAAPVSSMTSSSSTGPRPVPPYSGSIRRPTMPIPTSGPQIRVIATRRFHRGADGGLRAPVAHQPADRVADRAPLLGGRGRHNNFSSTIAILVHGNAEPHVLLGVGRRSTAREPSISSFLPGEVRETRVVPAKAGTHMSRIFDSSMMLPRLTLNPERQGLWVPAFAGTTYR